MTWSFEIIDSFERMYRFERSGESHLEYLHSETVVSLSRRE